jgi:hypothetical protein
VLAGKGEAIQRLGDVTLEYEGGPLIYTENDRDISIARDDRMGNNAGLVSIP